MSFSLWRSSPLFVALTIVTVMVVGPPAPAAGQIVVEPLPIDDEEPGDQPSDDAPDGEGDGDDQPMATGHAAIDRLGEDLAQVATANGLDGEELRDLLLADTSLTVDPQGHLLYLDIDEVGPDPEIGIEIGIGIDGVDSPAPQGAALLETPQLDDELSLASLPGAPHTVLLDIDGHVTAGTRWNAVDDRPAIVSGPFDLDGDPSSWSAEERAAISEAWAVVAEDFAPWNVNVTTIEPTHPGDLSHEGPEDARWGIRVVLSPDDWMACGCDAATYVGSLTEGADEPAFVHVVDPGLVGEAASHAVGHALGLIHDGADDGTVRHRGHESLGGPDWAPIMGAPSGTAISQWSDQDFVGADNNGQEDQAIISSSGTGFDRRPDDHGDQSDPTPLNGPDPAVDGIIATATDTDAFAFTTTGGTVSLAVAGDPISTNLDVGLTLLDQGGDIVATDDPPDRLSAGLGLDLPAGDYTVIVDGVGVGLPFLDPPTGYTDGASVGRYTLTGTIVGAAPADLEAPAAPDGVIGIGIEGLVVLGWAPAGDDDVDRYVVLRSAELGGPTVEVATVAAEQNGYEDAIPRLGVSYYAVVAVDAVGNRSAPSAAVEVTVEPTIGTFPDPDPDAGPELDPNPPDPDGEDAEPATEDQPDSDPDTDTEPKIDDEQDGDDDAEQEDAEPATEQEDAEPATEQEPERETFVYGVVTGDVASIAEADGRGQWVTETLSGGAERARHDRLDHRWVVPPASGNQSLHVVAAAGEDAGDADEGFVIAWSTDRVDWIDLTTIAPGEELDATFAIGAPEGDVHVRVLDTDRTPRQQSPDSVFIDLIRVIGDGRPVEPDPEPTEALAELRHHFQGLGEGERAVVVAGALTDELGDPVIGATMRVRIDGDIAETITITTGGSGTGTEQSEGAVLRPEVEVCLVSVEAEGLHWQPGPDDCPENQDEDEDENQDEDENENQDEDELSDPDQPDGAHTATEELAGSEIQ